MPTALHFSTWCDSQSWSIYVPSGQTLSEIKKEWLPKNEQGIKGYSDIPPKHLTDIDEKTQKNINTLFKDTGEFFKTTLKSLIDVKKILFKAPTIFDLVFLRKELLILC